jgi:hypothetical protein
VMVISQVERTQNVHKATLTYYKRA